MTPPKRILTFFTIATVLAGCTQHKPQAQIQASQQTLTNVSSVRAQNSQSPLSGPQFVTVSAKGNKVNPLINVASLNQDCTLKSLNTVTFATLPAHGQAVVAAHDGYSSYGATSPLAACNKEESPGNFIDYTPNAGYVGPDFIAADVTTSSGQTVRWMITVTVASQKHHGLMDRLEGNE